MQPLFSPKAGWVVAAWALVACSSAHAQYWPARKMVAEVQAATIVGRDSSGAEIERFPLAQVRRAVMVLDRLAPLYELPPPNLFIGKGDSPNASIVVSSDGQQAMVINIAMLRLAGDSDDLMATVIGHELAHLKAQHLAKRAEASNSIGLWGAVVGTALDVGGLIQGRGNVGMGRALGGVGAEMASASFSRDQEREADAIGIKAMAGAGFDPAQAAKLWELMAARVGSKSLWIDSHPAHTERAAAMAQLATSLAPVYTAHRLSSRGLPVYADPYPDARHKNFDPAANELAVQSSYARARAAYVAKRYDEAVPLLREAANEAGGGDERVTTMLGALHESGLGGLVADAAQARELFGKAAATGFGPAIYALGLMNYNGKGAKDGKSDMPEARKLLVLADKRDEPRATSLLALMYRFGNGFAQNLFIARELAERAAVAGEPLGQALYATMVRDGMGGFADPAKGFDLLIQVAPRLPWASYQLGQSYETGKGTNPDRDKARDAYEAALKGGVREADERLQYLSKKP
ncbi:MAG: sel1 repeat family protein [Pseudomonadota bacterium]